MASADSLPVVAVHEGVGRWLGDVETASDVSREYRTGDVTRCTFWCAPDDEAWTSGLLAEGTGNAVVVTSAEYPLPWVGRVAAPSYDPPQIRIDCVSVEARLEGALTPSAYSYEGTAGGLVTDIVRRTADDHGWSFLRSRSAWLGPPFRAALGDRYLWPALRQVAADSGGEVWLEHRVSRSGVEAIVAYGQRRGSARQAVLAPGRGGTVADEIAWSASSESVIAMVRGVTGGTSAVQGLSERVRFDLKAESVPVERVHGARRRVTRAAGKALLGADVLLQLESLTDEGVLETAVRSRLGSPPAPERVLRVEATYDRELWREVIPGNLLRVVAPGAFVTGFTGWGRVIAAQPNEHLGLLFATVEAMADGE